MNAQPDYGLEAGRCITRDGLPFVTIGRVQSKSQPVAPCEADDFARLAAAAPELLAALQLALRELEGMHSCHHPTCEGGCPFDEAAQAARKAIARAGGGQ